MNYYEVKMQITPVFPLRDIFLQALADIGFESFTEEEYGLLAYVPEASWDEVGLKNMIDAVVDGYNQGNEDANQFAQVDSKFTIIPAQNWNAEWESQFDPIEVTQECRVKAPFHSSTGVRFEIEIEPKMSFGTGHHATTWLMMRESMDLDLDSKAVLDMGCGTAVLAILAEKKGAASVLAIDIDEWAFENSVENVERNGCKLIEVVQGGAEDIHGNFDVILANINRNILVRDGLSYLEHLNANGLLLLSGFYEEDAPILQEAFSALTFLRSRVKDGWCMLVFQNTK